MKFLIGYPQNPFLKERANLVGKRWISIKWYRYYKWYRVDCYKIMDGFMIHISKISIIVKYKKEQ